MNLELRSAWPLALRFAFICWLLANSLSPPPAVAQTGFRLDRILGDLNRPVYATHAPGDPNGLYIVPQRDAGTGAGLTTGTIFRYDLASGTKADFLQVTGLDKDVQGGLHALEFHPDYKPGVAGSKLYLVLLKPSGTSLFSTSHLEEWALDAGGKPVYKRTLLQVAGLKDDDATHAMDWIGFRPGATGDERNWLYVTNGDGGIQCCGGSYVNNSQDLNSLYGKVLRLGVAGGDDLPSDPTRNYEFTPTIYHNDNEAAPGGPGPTAAEVLYSGLRNPWRASFDRGTGDIWLGDIGRSAREEIDYVKGGVIGRDASGNPASPGDGAAAGIDFGWSRREGLTSVDDVGELDPDGAGIRPNSINPVREFPRTGTEKHRSITGGYVYRGPQTDPAIQGKYFWSEAFYNLHFVGAIDSSGNFSFNNITQQYFDSLSGTGFKLDRVASYGEDAAGNVYLIDLGEPGSSSDSDETGYRPFITKFGKGEIYRVSYVVRPQVQTSGSSSGRTWRPLERLRAKLRRR